MWEVKLYRYNIVVYYLNKMTLDDEREYTMEEQEKTFKSYLRLQVVRHLEEIKTAIENEDTEKAQELTRQLIDDVRRGIED